MSLAKSKNNQAFSTATNLISHNNNVIIERDDTPPPPPYSSVISEIIHGGIELLPIHVLVTSTLSHMMAIVTPAESDVPHCQTESFTEFEVPCKVAVNKVVK